MNVRSFVITNCEEVQWQDVKHGDVCILLDGTAYGFVTGSADRMWLTGFVCAGGKFYRLKQVEEVKK